MSRLELLEARSREFCPQHLRNDTVETFRNCLNVVLANSEEMLDRAFRLRFQVYCLERGFRESRSISGNYPV